MSIFNLNNKTRHFYLLVIACILGILIAGQAIPADESKQEPPKSVSPKLRRLRHPHCGVYCLYTAIKLGNRDVNFQDLVKPEYIGSRKGSSLAELKKAAEDHKMYAVPVAKMASRQLRASAYPIILHVKFDARSALYDHYVLFLGTEGDKARLFDPPEPAKLVPFHELAPLWDGAGLIVSATAIDTGPIFASARRRFGMYTAIIVGVVLMVRRVRRRWLPSLLMMPRYQLLGLSITQAVGLLLVTSASGMVYHFVNEEGFLAHANATASIEQAHIGNFIPKMTKGKVEKLLNTNAVFIDARFARDFETGHLEGAISIPVDANDLQRLQAVADVDKDARIVVYCQSAGCKFAESVAIKLMADGFSNLSIFKGGWHEWAVKKR